jgi:hypothetical protein
MKGMEPRILKISISDRHTESVRWQYLESGRCNDCEKMVDCSDESDNTGNNYGIEAGSSERFQQGAK